MVPKKKNMGTAREKSFLLTLVVSILILICVPFAVFQIFLVKQSTSEIQHTNTTFYKSALHSCANSYNEQVILLRYNALNIGLDPKLAMPLKAESTAYDIYVAAQTLESYEKGVRSVADIGVYYPTRNYVLMDGYKRTMSMFFEKLGAGDVQSQNALLAYMTNNKEQGAFAVPAPDGALILARPLHLRSQYEFDCVVFYLLDKENLEGIFRANLPHGADVAVVHQNGNWVLTSETFRQDFVEQGAFHEYLNNRTAQVFEVESSSGPLQIHQYYDQTSQHTYLAAVRKEDALKVIQEYSDRISISVILSLVMLCALACMTIYISYTPLKKLVHKHTSGRGSMSELERLDSAFFARDERISSLRSLLGSMLLGELIYGSRKKAAFLSEELGCEKFKYFTIVTVSSDQLPASETYQIAEQLSESTDVAEVFTTSMPNRAHVLFLLLSDKVMDPVLIQADAILALRQVAGYEGDVRVGDIVHSLNDARKSYYSSFMDFATETEMLKSPEGTIYPAKDAQVFVQCACVGDRETALQMLDKLEFSFNARQFPENYRQYYAYKLLAAYLSGVNENTAGIPKEEMDELMAFVDYTELFVLLRKSVTACCERLALMTEMANAEMQNKLIQYVDEHLTHMDLCLSTAAEQLNMSVYAVSRLFKEGTGYGFKEYVINKRLERAMELLTTTDTPVGEIARSIGFENSTYFSTAFKKHYGISPTQLRN